MQLAKAQLHTQRVKAAAPVSLVDVLRGRGAPEIQRTDQLPVCLGAEQCLERKIAREPTGVAPIADRAFLECSQLHVWHRAGSSSIVLVGLVGHLSDFITFGARPRLCRRVEHARSERTLDELSGELAHGTATHDCLLDRTDLWWGVLSLPW